MRLGKIRHTITRLCWRLLVGTVARMPERNQICEFDCRATACDWEKWESCERRLGASGEVQGQMDSCRLPTQNGAVETVSQRLSASDIAREVTGHNPRTNINNVLVLGTEKSVPLKRTELGFGDPQEASAALNALEDALQRNGVEFRTVRNPDMPHTEIWLTSLLHDGRKALLSCAVTASDQTGNVLRRRPDQPAEQALQSRSPVRKLHQPREAASERWPLRPKEMA